MKSAKSDCGPDGPQKPKKKPATKSGRDTGRKGPKQVYAGLFSKLAKSKKPCASPVGLAPPPPASLLDLRPDGAFRPPDFRWQLAGRLAAGELIPEEWVDAWVLRAEEVLTTTTAAVRDAPDLRAISAARDLYERGAYWLKVEVEARVLAGEPTAVIAAKSGLATAAAAAYAALFFAVADRLRHPAHISHVVLRRYAPGGESDPGVQVRLIGYQAGPHALDAVLEAVAGPRSGGPHGGEPRDGKTQRLLRLAVGLRTTPVTEANAVPWARLHLLMRECRALGVKAG